MEPARNAALDAGGGAAVTLNLIEPSYDEFLRAKVAQHGDAGLTISREALHPILKPHQADAVLWMLRKGRAALFAGFGLGKTLCQLEVARQLLANGVERALIVLPLGVRQEFMRDAGLIDVKPVFVRRSEEVGGPGIYLSNYESVRAGKLDVGLFQSVSLDEAAILRGFGSSLTFRECMSQFEGTQYRFVATATPSPNEFIELLAYSAFLDVLDVGHGKTRFFKRDSSNADKLTLHPHKVEEFWLWVASWALFITKPSDLGHDDAGYDLPPFEVRWHEVESDHSQAGAERDGQARMFRNAAIGVSDAAAEKRASLPQRMGRLETLLDDGRDEQDQVVVWVDLNDEQEAVERAIEARGLSYSSIQGSQSLDEQEMLLRRWRDRETHILIAKASMLGCGVNLQQCNRALFLGIGHKFHAFVQAVHRIHRFGQTRPVRVDLLYSEAERDIRRSLEAKWARHDEQMARMREIVREFGLSRLAMAERLRRSIGVSRQEAAGDAWRLVNNDAILETAEMPAASVGLIVTSIPFATQYEYSPNYSDFGHTDDNDHFWRQMDFLSPHLFRVLQPGRVMAIHVKDRIVPGGLTGLGFQTLHPFHCEAIDHYRRHGFAFLGMKTITTDVVRENNQTYRLGWSEQCKDGSRMGCGVPEYVLLFRRPPSDAGSGYADVPVVKDKPHCTDDDGHVLPFDKRSNWKRPVPGTGYTRAAWQLDAHGYTRSSGNRLLSADELRTLPHEQLFKWWREHSSEQVYDYREHLTVCEQLDETQRLPATFMLFPPHSPHPDVWSDVARMRTLNGEQVQKGREVHLCPLQFDIVDRLIVQFSMPGEVVFDPFAGIGTVPVQALKLGRRGLGVELSAAYWRDAVIYCRAEEERRSTPTLFDLLEPSLSEAAD